MYENCPSIVTGTRAVVVVEEVVVTTSVVVSVREVVVVVEVVVLEIVVKVAVFVLVSIDSMVKPPETTVLVNVDVVPGGANASVPPLAVTVTVVFVGAGNVITKAYPITNPATAQITIPNVAAIVVTLLRRLFVWSVFKISQHFKPCDLYSRVSQIASHHSLSIIQIAF